MKFASFVVVLLTVFSLASMGSTFVHTNATAMTYCCTSSLANTGTLSSYGNPGDTATGEIWSTAQGPTGKFWAVQIYAGTSGGSPTEEGGFFYTVQDYSSGLYTSVGGCSDVKSDWGAAGALTYNCSVSLYLSGSMDVSWLFTNYDTTYSRIYEFQAIAYYH